MKYLFLHVEGSIQSALDDAVQQVQRKDGLKVEAKFWASRQLGEDSPHWREFEQDLKSCDFFLANMITEAAMVERLADLIKTYGPARPDRAIVVLNSMPSLMMATRLGNFEFNGLMRFFREGPIAKVSGLVQKFSSHKNETAQDEDYDPDERAPRRLRQHKPVKKNAINGLVTAMRVLPNVLKLVPGQAQDLRAYMLIMLYWLNCSPENLAEFLKFVTDRYVPGYKGPKLKYKDPILYPRLALFHPAAPGKTWTELADFEKWLAKARPQSVGRPRVGLVMMQATYLVNNLRPVTGLVEELAAQGIEAVPCYVGGLDFRPAIEKFFLQEDKSGQVKPTVDLVINITGFALVGGPAQSDTAAAVAQMRRLNRPVWAILPLLFQSEEEWRASRTGLTPLQTALEVAVPELDGALETRVYAAGSDQSDDKTFYPLPQETHRVAERAARLLKLTHQPNAAKKIAVVLFSFPPDKGNTGTAAYLGVFESLWKLMKRLQEAGYTVDLPANAEELRLAIVEGNSTAYGTTANLHSHLAVPDYQRLFPGWTEIEPFWGPPPGPILSDHQGLQILGRQFGNLLVTVQPTFGYEDDPLRLLMSDNVATHHGFAAFYTYLDKVWQADAVLHFGTHGALEFMPGKQVGLSAKCWPDRLIGGLPNFYLYCVNNPSEGTIAKRRGFATLLSYLSPPMENAGLYRQLVQLKDLLNAYRRDLKDGATKPDPAALETIKDLTEALELKPKIDPAQDEAGYILDLYNQLLEIEERLIPTGLHILDEAPVQDERLDMLNSIASFARGRPGSDEEITSLTEVITQGLGHNLEQIRQDASHNEEALAVWERINRLQRQAVSLFLLELDQTHALDQAIRRTTRYLQEQIQLDPVRTRPMWQYLAEIVEALESSDEIGQLLRAFDGEYIEPSPGSNIVQNPAVLPTGRNIHALDPSLIPTPLARRNAEKSAGALLERATAEIGAIPETMAMVLWGTDNIKSDGEGIAQCLYLLGARAVADGLGKISGIKLLPLSELGRPRIDVVITVSGIFRDLLPNQLALLDRAVRMAAQADEDPQMNFVRKHVDQEMQRGQSFDEAVARVFSNAPGQYGASVNFMVESSNWEQDSELSEAFLSRKSFVYGLKASGDTARQLMENALRRVDVAFQNVDSAEVGLTDVDHYFEYLGGISKVAEKLNGGKRPPSLVADSISATGNTLNQGHGIKTLEEAVKLEARTKLLNPKWYEGMLKYGFEGVREIEVRLTNTYGWSATVNAVDNWVYNQVYDTYMNDSAMRERLTQLNAYSFKNMVGRLLEANGRGFWEADAAILAQLKELYAGLEDEIEGLGGTGKPAALVSSTPML